MADYLDDYQQQDDPNAYLRGGDPNAPPAQSAPVVANAPYPGMLNFPGLNDDQAGSYLKDITDGIVAPAFQSTVGRAPSQQELQQGLTVYRNSGGDAFRQWVAGLAPQSGNGGSGGAAPLSGVATGQQFFQYPDWTPPNIAFGEFKAPQRTFGDFEYPDFAGPTADTFQADPGYQFRQDAMSRAIKNQKSSQGLLATGGTLTDLMSYAGGLASQEFGNVWDRNFKTWDANRNEALSEYGAKNDRFNQDFTQGLTSYLTDAEAKQQAWERSREQYTTNLNKEASSYGMNLDTNQFNLASNNSSFGNLLSLYGLMTKNLPTYTPAVAGA